MVDPFFIPDNITEKRILISALDWGMGHTTRCVALIQQFLDQQNQIIFVGDKKQVAFIQKDFPGIEVQLLEGYGITLDSKKSTYLQMANQQKKMMKAVKRENNWVKSFLASNQIDLIVSDNRYGFYHPKVTSILLTHQLNLQVPKFRFIANWIVKRMVEKFDACWVPDFEDQRLTGELSNHQQEIPVVFIGPLCRFKRSTTELKYDYLIILSGPEPERTNFMNSILDRVEELKGQVALVGAFTEYYDSFQNPTSAELQDLIAGSDCIISRAGYTTIMEMYVLNKKAILYPTKGQYEQEYLASSQNYPTIEMQF